MNEEKKHFVIGVRISKTLKERLNQCLKYKGVDQTTFIRTQIINFVDEVEAEMEKKRHKEYIKEFFTKKQSIIKKNGGDE